MNTTGLVVYGGTPLAPPLSMTYLNLEDVIKHPKVGRFRRYPLRRCLNQAKRETPKTEIKMSMISQINKLTLNNFSLILNSS